MKFFFICLYYFVFKTIFSHRNSNSIISDYILPLLSICSSIISDSITYLLHKIMSSTDDAIKFYESMGKMCNSYLRLKEPALQSEFLYGLNPSVLLEVLAFKEKNVNNASLCCYRR